MAKIEDFGCFLSSAGIALSSLVEAPLVRDRFKTRFEDPQLRTRVAGLLTTVAYQKARLIAEKLHQHLSFRFSTPEIRGMLQVDWDEYIRKMRTVCDSSSRYASSLIIVASVSASRKQNMEI